MIVPHQSQPLGQRIGRDEHAVEPPGLEPFGIARGRGGIADRTGGQFERGVFEIRRFAGRRLGVARGDGRPRTGEQPLDGLLRSIGQVCLQHRPRSAEGGAAVQVDRPGQIPRGLAGRLVRSPSRLGIGFLREIGHRATSSAQAGGRPGACSGSWTVTSPTSSVSPAATENSFSRYSLTSPNAYRR